MKIRRIPKNEQRGHCHDCHNRAELEFDFGKYRELLRLCYRDAKYMIGFAQRLIDDEERGDPVPPVKRRGDEDARGNR